MKQAEPCRAFTSEDPGAGAHWPDPCVICGWSQPEHDMYWQARDLKNDILMAVNKALNGTGLSIARSTIDGEDTYQVLRLPIFIEAPQIDLSNHHNALVCPYCNPRGLKFTESPNAVALQALKNSGIDTECGACMEVAFTGVTTNEHTCKSHRRRPNKGWSAGSA